MTDRIISVGEIRRGSLRQVQSLGFEPSLAPPRLVTLAARYRRSPEGCFESGLVVLGGCWAAPPWRSAVRPWLKAAACEFGRSQVPWSRCALFPVDVMIEPVAASAAPPERLELRSPHTSVLLHSASLQRAGFPSRVGPPTDSPRLQSAGGASGERPYAGVTPGPDPTIPPTARSRFLR